MTLKRALGFTAALVLVGLAAASLMRPDDDLVATDPAPLEGDSPFRYPIELWDRGVQGETVLMVHVTDMGRVDSAYVLLSSGQAAFDSAALAGSPALRFAPARRGDERVASWARLPVRFRMPGDSAAPAGGPPGT